ncbi:MAG: DUF1553 domain-containing protein [Planctomycetes bacterium]|nr:DUF1553 domain-containing protein [Planctomycetota bacterium]
MPRTLTALLTLLLSSSTLPAEETVDYLRGVKPILAARCFSCHGALQQKSKLRVDTVELMKKGGTSGPAIVPGKSAKSLLIDHVSTKDENDRMPPNSEGEGLKPVEIALLRAWIDQGAAGPADEKPETDPKDHWAFKTPVKVAPPKPGNPIDAFISAERDKRKLTPQAPADKRILLRRLYIDLTGLPPTRAELDAFLAADAVNPQSAYTEVVDRLLASKQYGERWGRHWMDVWRYSDWWGLGAEVRNSQKHIWHWRDWIIESLNADKGYDQMVREMLAADELYPTDADKLRGSGFLARQYFKFNRNTWMEETVEHTSKAFLGLTMNCSKCHDHKYDPISQQDFYRFRAFFEPYQIRTDMVPGVTDFEKDGLPRVFDCNLTAPTYLFIRGDEKNPRKDQAIPPGLPEILSFSKLEISTVNLPAEAHNPGLSEEVLATHLLAAEKQITDAKAALELAKKAKPETDQTRTAIVVAEKSLALASLQPDLIRARFAAEKARLAMAANAKEVARAAALLEKKSAVAVAEDALAKAEQEIAKALAAKKAENEKKVVAAKAALAKAKKDLETPGETFTALRGSLKTLESNLEGEPSRSKPYPTTSTGRRSALAKWITDARNPLTARVAVNHIWARHFGKPLVATVFDFGRKGAPPTHPELLDWLAVELMEKNWNMKQLHRMIVTSDVYRLSSSSAQASGDTISLDAENRYYWRMNPIRMEAQVIRDSLLLLSGELDQTVGGPSIPAADETSRRRGMYFVHSHNEHNKFLSIFDDANVLECYRRSESIVPQQALALENSKLALAAAEKIAKRLNEPNDVAFAKAAFELVLGSSPTKEEQAECVNAMKELKAIATREKRADAAMRARVNLVHALLNHNDFVTVR